VPLLATSTKRRSWSASITGIGQVSCAEKALRPPVKIIESPKLHLHSSIGVDKPNTDGDKPRFTDPLGKLP
jgi:hypothetical protein